MRFEKENTLMMETLESAKRLYNLAFDAFIDAIPDEKYDNCPCGCGQKYKFIEKDPKILRNHVKTFMKKWMKENKEKI